MAKADYYTVPMHGPQIYDPGAVLADPRHERFCGAGNSVAISTGASDARAALVAADGVDAPLVLAHGATYLVNSALTLTGRIVGYGGLLKPASGVTVTISGPFDAGLYQCFDLSLGGTVSFTAGAAERFLPQWWGATGNGSTDDTAAIIRAGAALQAAGGGRLDFAHGTYRVFSTDYAASLGAVYTDKLLALNGVHGVHVKGFDARIFVDRALSAGEYPVFVEATDCMDFSMEGFDLAALGAEAWAASARERGLVALNAVGGCRNLTMRNNSLTGGQGLRAAAASGAADSARTIGILIDGLRLTRVAYGISCQFSGDSLEARGVISDSPHRTYISYGIRDHKLSIVSKNQDADDVIVGAFEGYGCENVEVNYTNVDSDAALPAAPCVAIQYGDITPATMRDLRFNVDLRWNVAGYFGHGILLAKYMAGFVYDTADSPHVLSGLTVKGRFRDTAGAGIPFYVGGLWGAASTQERIDMSDLAFESTGNPALVFDALRGRALISNVDASGVNLYIRGSADGLITVLNAKALSLCADAADTTEINYIDCEIEDATNQSFTNKRFLNTTVNSVVYNTLRSALPSSAAPTLRLNDAQVFGGRDSLVDLSTVAVSLNGGRSFGSGVTHFKITTIDGHQGTFSLYVGLQSGTAFSAVHTGGGNCTVTPAGSSFGVVVAGDARTYTFAVVAGSGAITLVSSALATGTTEVGYFTVNA